MSSRTNPSKPKIIAFVIVLILFPIFALVGLELTARVAISLMYGVPGKSYGIFQSDPVLGHFPAPNTYNHFTSQNDHGFRNNRDVIEPRPKGAKRIVTYGGSTTFCPKLTTEACWSGQLQKRLQAGDGNTDHQVLNGGVVLWSLGHALERARRELPSLRPDMVIIYSGFNEPSNAIHLKTAGTPIEKLVAEGKFSVAAANYPASNWLHYYSILYKISRAVVVSGLDHFKPPVASTPAGQAAKPVSEPDSQKTGTAPRRFVNPAVLKNYLVTLERFVKLVRDNGAEPIFVIQASAADFSPIYSELGAKTACDLGVRVLDARKAVADYPGDKADLFRSKIHYSATGTSEFARYLHEYLFKREGYSVCNGYQAPTYEPAS